MVKIIIQILINVKNQKIKKLRRCVVLKLIQLISLLCSFSIEPEHLKSILNLMSNWTQYAPNLLSALSEMPQIPSIAQHSFELYEYGSGITANSISATATGFTFFCWICLDQMNSSEFRNFPRRRVIFNLLDDQFRGFEIFISQKNELVVGISEKNEYLYYSNDFTKVMDGQWHSLSVTWSNQTKIGQLRSTGLSWIVVDGFEFGRPVSVPIPTTSQLRVRIGIGLDVPNSTLTTDKNKNTSGFIKASNSLSSIAGAAFGVVSGVAKKVTRSTSSNSISADICQIPQLDQDEKFGRPGPLCGLLGYSSLIEATMTPKQNQFLHELGPNSLSQYQSTCSHTANLQRNLKIYYHPKNIDAHRVYNLAPVWPGAPSDNNDASLVGKTHGATDLRSAIHALSGVTVIYPLLEDIKFWTVQSKHLSDRSSSNIMSHNDRQ